MLKTPVPGRAGHAVPFFLVARVPSIARTARQSDSLRVLPLAENVNGRGTSERSGASIPAQTAGNNILLQAAIKSIVPDAHLKCALKK